MTKRFQPILLLACLTIVLAVATACAPLATPAPAPPAADNSITGDSGEFVIATTNPPTGGGTSQLVDGGLVR